MAALTLDRQPAAAPVGQQTRDAQPGARAQQGDGRIGLRRPAADLAQLAGRQHRQGQRQRGEIVEQLQGLQAELGLDRRLGKGPVVVGHAHFVAGDGVGNGDRGGLRPALAQTIQVGVHRRLQRGEIGAGQHPHIGDGGARRGLPGEARIGAADVGEQAGKWRKGGNDDGRHGAR